MTRWGLKDSKTLMLLPGTACDYQANFGTVLDRLGKKYTWVRNPMYSGWWMLFAGICLQWHNAWALLTVPVNWMILTVTLKFTEEKWLLDLYKQDYANYMKRVNRCIPWPPRKA